MSPLKKIKVAKNNIVQSTDLFRGLDYEKTVTAEQIKTIKKFNRFNEEVAKANLNSVVTALQSSYFLYDNHNIIRETFISELQKQVYLICGVSFFDKVGSDGKMFLIETKDKMKFDDKENKQICYFNFNLSPTHASETIKYIKKEINNIMIIATEKLTKIGQKRKKTVVLETILVKALQNYDKYTVLNPLEVILRSNYLNQKINDYEGFTFKDILRNLLFSSSITNDTQNIFVTCRNLNSAKKALINGKIYDVLGVVNLREIKNWDSIKMNSIHVNVKFDDSHFMENAKHVGFKFKTSFPTEFLEFTCELLDDKANQINFVSGEQKVLILDIQIDIVK